MSTTKRIIQRKLPLDQKYTLISSSYVSLIDGTGCTCDNCGKLIANIANVKGDTSGKFHSIGFDCLETFLINNNILDQKGTEHYETVIKKSIGKVKKIRETIKAFLKANPFIDAVELEYSSFLSTWIKFNYFYNGKQKWNDGVKIKEMDLEMLLASVKTISNKVTFTLTNK